MSKDWKIFFCDEVSPGNHNKVNLISCIFFSPIFISSDDYMLLSNLVMIGKVKKKDIGKEIKVSINCEYKDSSNEKGHKMTIYVVPEFTGEVIPVFLAIPFNIILKRDGKMTVNIYIGKRSIHKELFYVEYGNSPSTRIFGRIGTSGLISGEKDSLNLSVLLKGADEELIIIDQYLPQRALIDLLREVDKRIIIKVLTGFNYKESYNNKLKELGYENIGIRLSNLFHDRYIIINTTEAYKFGYSLKDLYKGRVSSYSKLINKEEYESTLLRFNLEWEQSEVII